MSALPMVTTQAVPRSALERLTAVPGALTRYLVGITATRTRDRAWRDCGACCRCGAPVTDPAAAGLVRTDAGDRVACFPNCYLEALTAPQSTTTTRTLHEVA